MKLNAINNIAQKEAKSFQYPGQRFEKQDAIVEQ